MRLSLILLAVLCALAGCDTDPSNFESELDPAEGLLSGVANGIAFSDSVQVRYDPETERASVRAFFPGVPGARCGAFSALFVLRPEPSTQDLRLDYEGQDRRGLLVSDGSDPICSFFRPTPSDENRITLVAGSRPGALTGTFDVTLVNEVVGAGIDTLRVENGRVAFSISRQE